MNKLKNKSFYYRTSVLEEYLGKLGYLPRWIVFCIDLSLLLVANFITYNLISNLTTTFYDTLEVPVRYGIIVFVNLIFFLLFRTYSGIIRHSSFFDGIKLFFSTSCSFFLLVLINYVTYFSIGKKIYLIPSLIVNYAITFLLLFLFRIFVKKFFEILKFKQNDSGTLRAVIYGSDANAIFVANALKAEIPSRFKLVAFINKSENN